MKAVLASPPAAPIYGDFDDPVADPQSEVVEVLAAALTNLDVAKFQQDFGSLTGNGTVSDNGAATQLNVGVRGISSTFNGLLQNGTGTLSLGKMGAGTTILTNNDTYTGTTTISAGTLQLGNGGTNSTISGTSGITDNGALTPATTTTSSCAFSVLRCTASHHRLMRLVRSPPARRS